MVACINIFNPQNRLSAEAPVDVSAVSCFLRVSDHLESICKKIFVTEKFDFRNLENFAMYDVITDDPVVKISVCGYPKRKTYFIFVSHLKQSLFFKILLINILI